jgi:ubiquinone/menaquinone biosynthesis C-methylase UbiE
VHLGDRVCRNNVIRPDRNLSGLTNHIRRAVIRTVYSPLGRPANQMVGAYLEIGYPIMNTEKLERTTLGKIFVRAMALIMESRFRYKFFGPQKILESAGIHQGMRVLEIGCGTGFFTIPAGRMLGNNGSLIAMDMLPISVETVAKKVQETNLSNVVRVVKADALNTKLEKESLDEVIIFGVIPAPMLPMGKLLEEMHRILRPDGIMAVWPPSWVHQTIIQSGYFRYIKRRNGVSNYQRIDQVSAYRLTSLSRDEGKSD